MKEFIINENEAGQRFDKYLGKLLRENPTSVNFKFASKLKRNCITKFYTFQTQI